MTTARSYLKQCPYLKPVPFLLREIWAGLGYHHGLEEDLDFWLKRAHEEYAYYTSEEDLIFMQELNKTEHYVSRKSEKGK